MNSVEKKLLAELEADLGQTVTFSASETEPDVAGEILRRIENALLKFESEEAKREAFENLAREALAEKLISEPGILFENFPKYGAEVGRVTEALDAPSIRVSQFFEEDKTGSGEATTVMKRTLEPVHRYDVGDEVARGGMGAIRLGRDQTLMREVAIKSMLKLAPESGENHRDMARFVEEAQVTGQLEHPGIVPVYELGVDDASQVFYTMKFVRGKTLQSILMGIRNGEEEFIRDYPLHRLVQLFYRVCDAMAFAHSRGVVHRDLKPANLMIGEFGEVFVMDWGLAKILGRKEQNTESEQEEFVESIRTVDGSVDFQTLAGQIGGTPEFMAPEQARGETFRIDARTDIYALGAILYSILTLRAPIRGTSVFEKLKKVDRGEIEEPRNFEGDGKLIHCPAGKVPEALAAVALRAMAHDPDNRYRSVKRLQGEIDAYERGFATRAEDAGFVTLALLFLKRHRGAMAFIAGIFTVLLVSSIVLLQQRNAAVAARNHSDQLSAWLEADKVKSLLDEDRGVEAVPYLASQLRRDSTDSIAAQRLLQILTYHNFAVPTTVPLSHQSRMTTAKFSNDGKTVYTTSAAKYDSRLVTWDFKTGDLKKSMRHDEAIKHLAISADGKIGVTPSMDGTTGVWNLETGEKIVSLSSIEKGRAFKAAIDPAGNFAAVTCGRRCRVWSIPDGEEIEALPKDAGHWVFDVEISPDGKWLAYGGLNNEVVVFNTKTWTNSHNIKTNHGILTLEFSNNSNLLAIGDHAEARVWNLAEDRLEGQILQIRGRFRDLKFNQEADLLLVGTEMREAFLWNFRTGEEPIPRMQHLGGVGRVRFSPNEKWIATGGQDHTARIWDAATGEPVMSPLRHDGKIEDLNFHPSGKFLVTASEDRSAIVWDIRNSKAKNLVKKQSTMIRHARLQGENDALIFTVSTAGEALWLNAETLAVVRRWPVPQSENRIFDAELHPRTGVALALDEANRLFRHEPDSEKPTVIAKYTEQLAAIRLDPKGENYFVMETHPQRMQTKGKMHLYDAESDEVRFLARMPITRGGLRFLDPVPYDWSPNSKVCFLSGTTQSHQLTDARNGAPLGNQGLSRFRNVAMKFGGRVTDYQFTRDSKYIATTDTDGIARLWNGRNGQPVSPPMRHLARVNSLHFSTDETHMVTGSDDRTAVVWNPKTGEQIVESFPHESPVTVAEYSPDARVIATGTENGAVRFWDANIGQPVSSIFSVDSPSAAVLFKFSDDGTLLTSTFRFGNIGVFPTLTPPINVPAPDWLPELAEALVGERLNERGVRESVFGREFAKLCEEIRNTEIADPFYEAWRDWFFADRDTRSDFPRINR